VELGVKSRLIPFIVSTTLWTDRLPKDWPLLSPTEAENLVEIIDNISNIAKNFFLTSLFLAFHHLFVTLLPYLDVKLV